MSSTRRRKLIPRHNSSELKAFARSWMNCRPASTIAPRKRSPLGVSETCFSRPQTPAISLIETLFVQEPGQQIGNLQGIQIGERKVSIAPDTN